MGGVETATWRPETPIAGLAESSPLSKFGLIAIFPVITFGGHLGVKDAKLNQFQGGEYCETSIDGMFLQKVRVDVIY